MDANEESVHADTIRKGDVLKHPKSGKWFKTDLVGEGILGAKESDEHRKSTHIYFSGLDDDGNQIWFQSFISIDGFAPVLPDKNVQVTRRIPGV